MKTQVYSSFSYHYRELVFYPRMIHYGEELERTGSFANGFQKKLEWLYLEHVYLLLVLSYLTVEGRSEFFSICNFQACKLKNPHLPFLAYEGLTTKGHIFKMNMLCITPYSVVIFRVYISLLQ